jgi:hypothetical protein
VSWQGEPAKIFMKSGLDSLVDIINGSAEIFPVPGTQPSV